MVYIDRQRNAKQASYSLQCYVHKNGFNKVDILPTLTGYVMFTIILYISVYALDENINYKNKFIDFVVKLKFYSIINLSRFHDVIF